MTTLTLETPLLTIASSKEKDARSIMRVQQSITQTQVHEEVSDEELVHAICQGEEWAMEILYTRYHRCAYALAYRILHDSASAEDIVQEVFLSIWRKAPSYQRQHGSVYSWLQAIVHHRSIDRVRSTAYREQQWKSSQQEHEREREHGHGREQEPVSQQPDVWEEAWERERRALIRRALAQLPREQRQVIEQSYFDGYTHAEIAQRVNIPLGTVKGRMRLGLQKMRLLLQEYGLEAAL